VPAHHETAAHTCRDKLGWARLLVKPLHTSPAALQPFSKAAKRPANPRVGLIHVASQSFLALLQTVQIGADRLLLGANRLLALLQTVQIGADRLLLGANRLLALLQTVQIGADRLLLGANRLLALLDEAQIGADCLLLGVNLLLALLHARHPANQALH
jgi:hypothetical protein